MSGQGSLFDYKPKKKKTRADQILDAFIRYHKDNPKVWELFQQFSFEVINAGFENYSAWAISQRIRWHTTIETKGDDVKLSNNFIAYYSRLFHVAHPKHDGFFKNKKLTSQEKPAYETDIQFFPGADPSGEEDLINKLKELIKGDGNGDTK